MMGPFPLEMSRRFNQLKICLILMIASTVGVIIFMPMCFKVNTMSVILSSLNIILNAIFGIWMLQQDPTVASMYRCLTSTCCQYCGENCQGGLGCLMPFIFGNVLVIFFSIIQPVDFKFVFGSIGMLFNIAEWSDSLWGFKFVIYASCVIIKWASQIGGIAFGWLAYKQVRDQGVTVSGGDWARESGGGGGSVYRAGPGDRASSQSAPSRSNQNNFQAFEGSGQRLGS